MGVALIISKAETGSRRRTYFGSGMNGVQPEQVEWKILVRQISGDSYQAVGNVAGAWEQG